MRDRDGYSYTGGRRIKPTSEALHGPRAARLLAHTFLLHKLMDHSRGADSPDQFFACPREGDPQIQRRDVEHGCIQDTMPRRIGAAIAHEQNLCVIGKVLVHPLDRGERAAIEGEPIHLTRGVYPRVDLWRGQRWERNVAQRRARRARLQRHDRETEKRDADDPTADAVLFCDEPARRDSESSPSVAPLCRAARCPRTVILARRHIRCSTASPSRESRSSACGHTWSRSQSLRAVSAWRSP